MNPPNQRQQDWLDAGFLPWQVPGTFPRALAPFFVRERGVDLVFRLEISASHCNGASTAHGGFLATVADIVLGYGINHRIPAHWRIATTSLALQYLMPIIPGQWLEGRITQLRIGKRLCHATGSLEVEGLPAVAMQGIFSVLSSTEHTGTPPSHGTRQPPATPAGS